MNKWCSIDLYFYKAFQTGDITYFLPFTNLAKVYAKIVRKYSNE